MSCIEHLHIILAFCWSAFVCVMKQKDLEKPVVNPVLSPISDDPPPLPDSFRQAYWLRLADIALGRARAEQEKIKEQIRPHVERFKQITRDRKSRRKTA
ncbi:MAG: hypothetical protein JOZ80_05315 [Acidobacteriaceae bacterium]|nr:hypothetical protein [Acidobacteriaceae bacterium]